MPSRSEVGQIYDTTAQLMPAIQQRQDWPYEVPHHGRYASRQPATVYRSAGLDNLERRNAEDELGATVYNEVPNPERQLLALAPTMLSRGLVEEGDLASRMRAVRSRLEAV